MWSCQYRVRLRGAQPDTERMVGRVTLRGAQTSIGIAAQSNAWFGRRGFPMPTAGWVCLGLVGVAGLAIAALLGWLYLGRLREQAYYKEHAEPVLAWVIEDDSTLYSRGGYSRHALVLHTVRR